MLQNSEVFSPTNFDPFYANYTNADLVSPLSNNPTIVLSRPKYVTGLNSYQINSLPVQTTQTGIPLQPIKMRL